MERLSNDARVSAVERLEEVCKERRFKVITRCEEYKKPWLHLPVFKTAFVFGNANMDSLYCLINALKTNVGNVNT